jgi:cell wall-associated NlpC family hydrolase
MHVQALAKLIGVPFLDKGRTLAGVDCWGAVRLGLQLGFDITVPSYTEEYASAQERVEVEAFIGRHSIEWPEVPLSKACPGDVLLLRIFGQPWHCGLILTAPAFLHVDKTAGVVIERWDSLVWKKRIVAVHRYPGSSVLCSAHSVQ